MMNDNYTSDFANANVISYYNESTLIHSLRRHPLTGEVWSKSDIGETKHYNSLNDFYADGTTGAMYAMASRKYYNL